MEKHLFNLKFAAKEMERSSKKCDKEERIEKEKLKKSIQKNNLEVARIHAENAIRQKNQSLNFLRMSARIDAVASRVQSAVATKKVTQSMAGKMLKSFLFKITIVLYLEFCSFRKHDFLKKTVHDQI